jgi:outer membrane protein, heavy metal efflux system
MNRAIIPVLLVLLSGIVSAQDLQSYLELAARNNPGVQARYATFEASLARAAQVRGMPDPTLSVAYAVMPMPTFIGPLRARITLEQAFPWFGMLKARGEASALMAEADHLQYIDARNELAYSVRQAYYELYEIDRTIAVKREDLAILQQYHELALSRYRNGTGGMVDVYRAEMMINEATVELAILEDRVRPLQVMFNRMVGRDDREPVVLQDTLGMVEVPVDHRRDSIGVNPMIASMEYMERAALAEERMARKEGSPMFMLGVEYNVMDERTDMEVMDNGRNMIMPMVSVSLPIYRRKYKSAVEGAQALQRSYAAMRTATENDLHTTYERAMFDVERSRRMVRLYEEQVSLVDRSLELLLTTYTNAGEDFEELLRMRQQLLSYRTLHLTALREHLSAAAELDYITARSDIQP